MDLERALAELDERNADNVTRTESYLELYAACRLPWVLMAHLVSRNAGYLMSDLARSLERADETTRPAMENLFLLLERGNYLIFWDAWHHVLSALLGRGPTPPRATAFMSEAWERHRFRPDERRLVLDKVWNEQTFIEERVARNEARFGPGLRLLALVEAAGREKPIHFPGSDADIKVEGFARLEQRVRAGTRIYDEVVADEGRRQALSEWALAHPHTGSREVYGGKPGPGVAAAWPVAKVKAMAPWIHDEPEVSSSAAARSP